MLPDDPITLIDTGIAYDHLALGGGFGTSFRVVGGWDFAENDADPYDDAPAGFHGTHVLIGVVILLITALRLRSGKATGAGVELAGLYWHFVDLVWVFIFTFFYLI